MSANHDKKASAARPESLSKNSPRSLLEQLTRQNVEAIARLEKAAGADRGVTDLLADAITRLVGSMIFVYLHVAWFSLWVLFNTGLLTPRGWHFDPYPFTFLTFVVSLEAIFLSTFILISQNHEERLAQRRGQLDLQINLLAEQETSKILQMLEAIHSRLGIDVDPEVEGLEKTTSPDKLSQQIEAQLEQRSSHLDASH